MNFLFLMDPLHRVIVEKDTSFIMMLGAHRKGHDVFYLPHGRMTHSEGRLTFHAVNVLPQIDKKQPFIEKHQQTMTEDEVDAVFIRTDPPFDYNYLVNTWLLDALAERIPVINHPHGLRTVNEKIWATRFTSLIPKTLVSRHRKDLLAFLQQETDVVAKPTDGFGGQSVFHIHKGDKNANVILETVSQNFSREIILQKFIPEAKEGDKRILLLNGEPLGAVLRLHSEDDHRNNFFSGGKPLPAEINDRDREIIAALKPELTALGLYLVGIDILGGYLVEVNVTSPTCMQEMNQLYKQQLEDQVIAFVEKLVEDHESKAKIATN